MSNVGFSGSQNGMSYTQMVSVEAMLKSAKGTSVARHGDCIGGDSDFHSISRGCGLFLWGHPPIKENKRAWCHFDRTEEPAEYLDRNRDIVDNSDWMIFCPEGPEKLRSGTWSTIRYAKSLGKLGFIVWPDGEIEDL